MRLELRISVSVHAHISLASLQAVPYEMSLASVKKFLWQKSDDLIFHFR